MQDWPLGDEKPFKGTPEEWTEIMRRTMSESLPWYRKLIPFFPAIVYNKNLRLLTVTFGDYSTTTKSLTKTHFIDVLIRNYRTKWYHCKYVGFQIWRPW